jgi:hypothetical protein
VELKRRFDSNDVKVASFYPHYSFLNNARLLTARFESEFGPLVTPMLSQPLPPPVNLRVGNSGASLLGTNSATISGTLAVGVYGDDCASICLLFGRRHHASRLGPKPVPRREHEL